MLAGVPELPVGAGVEPPPPQATWNAHPLRTRKMRQKPSSFLRLGLLIPAPPSSMAGTMMAKANTVPEPFCPAGVFSAAVGPTVLTVNFALPTLFVTVIAPSEQVAAGFAAGVTLQLSATLVGFNPPSGVIVTVDVAEAPGATEPGDKFEDEILKSGAVTTTITSAEVLVT